jgi:hypothetical protein
MIKSLKLLYISLNSNLNSNCVYLNVVLCYVYLWQIFTTEPVIYALISWFCSHELNQIHWTLKHLVGIVELFTWYLPAHYVEDQN